MTNHLNPLAATIRSAQPGADACAPNPVIPTDGGEVQLYAKRPKIYQKEIRGPFQNLRAVTLFVLAGLYLVMPWVRWDDRQAVWFDLPTRHFHLFGLTFWPQDFIFLALLMMCAAYGLFFFTNFAGRLWCGYACPQTVWTKFFMWIEWLVEGDRNQRIRLDRTPWNCEKVLRKLAKHSSWLALSLVVGVTFVGYFSPIRELVPNLVTGALSNVELVAVAFFSLALYFDAGAMREQICKYACPYARFQGAMFDTETLTIFYDRARGEPRGSRSRQAEPTKNGLGDCIDCKLCVQVCPTGIDIRNGTQYECIGCAACIDACDGIMDKMGYAKGLVRYSTEDMLSGKPYHLFRPRLIGYGVVLVVMLSALGWGLVNRVPLVLDVLRDRARVYRITGDGLVENVYTLKLLNMDEEAHTFRISVSAPIDVTLNGAKDTTVASGAIADVPVRIEVAPEQLADAAVKVVFRIQALDDPSLQVEEDSRLIGPRKLGK